MSSRTPDQPILTHSLENQHDVVPAPGALQDVTPGFTRPPAHSRWPRLLLEVLAVAVVTWALGAFYTLHCNPEIAFFEHAARVKQTWAARIGHERGSKTVFFGGSSCTFSIDPERFLQKHGLPA